MTIATCLGTEQPEQRRRDGTYRFLQKYLRCRKFAETYRFRIGEFLNRARTIIELRKYYLSILTGRENVDLSLSTNFIL